jgi:hypothetical protein
MAEAKQTIGQEAAQRLYDLALDYAQRALEAQSDLIREFEGAALPSMRWVGAVLVDDDDDEHLILQADGHFAGRALDDDTGHWEHISSPDDVADHYDPVDLFTDLADAIAEMYPGLDTRDDEGTEPADGRPDKRGKVAARPPEPVGLDIWSDAPPETAATPPGSWETAPYDWSAYEGAPADAASARVDAAAAAVDASSEAVDASSAAVDRSSAAVDGSSAAVDRSVAGVDRPAAGVDASTVDPAAPRMEQVRVLEDLMKAGVMTKAQFEAAKAKLQAR